MYQWAFVKERRPKHSLRILLGVCLHAHARTHTYLLTHIHIFTHRIREREGGREGEREMTFNRMRRLRYWLHHYHCDLELATSTLLKRRKITRC